MSVKILKIIPTFPHTSCLSGVKFSLLKPSSFVLWLSRAGSTHAPGVILWSEERQGRSAPAQSCQRSRDRPWVLRPLPFCSEELPFFQSMQITRVTESSWYVLMYWNQLKGILNYRQTTSTKGEWCSATAEPRLWSDGRPASDVDQNPIQISSCLTGVFPFMLSENLLKWKNTKLLETTDSLVILVYCKNI